MPQNVRITLKVIPEANSQYFGLCLRGSDDYEKGCELRFEPSRQRVQFSAPHEGRMGADSGYAMEHIEGLDRPFTLDIVVKDDIVDVCIDNRRTIITRYWNPRGDRLFLFAQDADVAFDSVEVRPLSE